MQLKERIVLDYARKLALTPSDVTSEDLDQLRGQGYDDMALLEIVQVVGFFSYINRVADALGVEPEPEWDSR